MKWIFLFTCLSPFAFALTEQVLFIDSGSDNNQAWSKHTSSEELNVKKLLELLSRSPKGKELLKEAAEKAALKGQSIEEVIRPGDGSLTDTTLVRKFYPDRPERVTYETKSKVFINKAMPWREALLDLAHELTHYIHRETFNPYTLNFSAQDFVSSTIEGNGGEVHAFMSECLVMRELFTKDYAQNSNCSAIQDERGAPVRAKAVELFYQVGSFYSHIKKVMDEKGALGHFPKLTDEKIKFISSAYGVPYPLAALYEYQTVLTKVCENDKRRLTYMEQSRPQGGRAPASLETFRASLEKRCQNIQKIAQD